MKNYLTLFLLIVALCQKVQSQNYATTCVTYKVGWTRAVDTSKYVNVSLKTKINLINAKAALDLIECKLYFNSDKSFFNIVEKLAYEKSKDYRLASLEVRNKFFNDFQVKEKLKIGNSSPIYNVVVPFEAYKWTITAESKMISGYKCFKANGTYSLNSKENTDMTAFVTAWFAPEIAVQFGPNGFDGLPGLILEVVYRGNYIQATKIELAIENQKIKLERPDQGVYVSEKEYNLMLFDLYQKRKSPSKE